MTQEQALRVVRGFLREHFGSVLTTRECRRVRRVAGVNWLVRIVVPASSGDITITELDVDEQGQLAPQLSVDDLVKALRRADVVVEASGGATRPVAVADDPMSDFGDLAAVTDSFIDSIDDAVEGEAPPDDPDEVRRAVQGLLAQGDPASLRSARDLMPRLLGDAERRGITLVWMAEIERRLHDRRQALQYLEAAAREFADRFDMAALEKCAAMALTLTTLEQFAATTTSRLLDASRARMRPLSVIWEASSLSAISQEEREWLGAHAPIRTLAPGEVLLKEGDPSSNVFVIKSGLIAILIDMGDGNLRRVRYCYPGWLLGESSVLLSGATATATLRAHGPAEVYCIASEALKLVMAQNANLRRRIAATKHMHRLDSFFTTHDMLGQLDVQVRDEVIECVQRIEAFEEDTLLLKRGEPPSAALLVAKGEIALYDSPTWEKDAPPPAAKLVSTLGADAFFAMRDALHQAPAPLTAVARAGTTVAFFEAEKLRALIARSPEQATAVLERIG